jgi:nucleoid DNA-binding protein
MNHTERIHAVARQVRGLTREMARAAVEGYLASLADEAMRGEWVSLPGLGRLQIVARPCRGQLLAHVGSNIYEFRDPGFRLQARLHLNDTFRVRCRAHLISKPGQDRVKPGLVLNNPGSTRSETGKGRK